MSTICSQSMIVGVKIFAGILSKHKRKIVVIKALKTNNLYILLVATLGVSAVACLFLLLILTNSQIFWVRLQQVFGSIAFGYWYLLLLVSAVSKLKLWRGPQWYGRTFGWAVFYFASLHAGLGLFDRIGGFDKLSFLPSTFKWALLFAGFAYLFLVLEFLTRAVGMVGPWQRVRGWFVATTSVAVVLHIWLIGTHVTNPVIQTIIVSAVTTLVMLQAIIWSNRLLQKLRVSTVFMASITVIIFAGGMILLVLIPKKLTNYSQQHVHDENAQLQSGHHH